MTDLSKLFANVFAFIEGNPEAAEDEIVAFIKKDKFYSQQYIDADDICEICTFVCKNYIRKKHLYLGTGEYDDSHH